MPTNLASLEEQPKSTFIKSPNHTTHAFNLTVDCPIETERKTLEDSGETSEIVSFGSTFDFGDSGISDAHSPHDFDNCTYLLHESTSGSGKTDFQSARNTIASIRKGSGHPMWEISDSSEVESESHSRRSSSSSESGYLRINAFSGHRDTLARIKYDPNTRPNDSASINSDFEPSIASPSLYSLYYDRSLELPAEFWTRLLWYLTFDDYKSLRLTCWKWCNSIPTPKFPASYYCPPEILQQIYESLSPIDFDALRHTCKSYFQASLNRRLLLIMLRRAGCISSAQIDLSLHRGHLRGRTKAFDAKYEKGDRNLGTSNPRRSEDEFSDEWLFSKRLSTESTLSAEWKGPGVKVKFASPEIHREPLKMKGFIDFSQLLQSQRQSGDSSIQRKVFTVSGCGKFVLVLHGNKIHIYELLSDTYGLRPVSSIICPRIVLAVSMDTSSERYAVAILLEGRVGMCCSLSGALNKVESTDKVGEPMQLGMATDVYSSGDPVEPTEAAAPLILRQRTDSSEMLSWPAEESTRTAFDSTKSESGLNYNGAGNITGRTWFDEGFVRCSSPEQSLNDEAEKDQSNRIPIESGSRTIYNNLCSADDPPRSVAICPQRRCVAFGCQMGIELHWVDAFTGSNLSRWFPLAAPSDYLFFLPARAGVDSTKKLRLISSAAGPGDRTISRQGSTPPNWNWHPGSPGTRSRSMTRLFFGNLPFPTATVCSPPQTLSSESRALDRNQGVLRTVDCDYYRAIPLSDGAHLIFTDPETGYLCLGSDAPLGGPTKLLRKVICLPPTIDVLENISQEGTIETVFRSSIACYAAGQDLRWGIRIAVAYDDGKMILYCIPPDVFEVLKAPTISPDVWDERAGVIGQSDLLMDNFMQTQAHLNANTSPNASNEAGASVENHWNYLDLRPISLRGTEIGSFTGENIEDIAVDCSFGGLKIWIFTSNGTAKLWDVFSGQESRTSYVDGRGVVKDEDNISPGRRDPSRKQAERHIRFFGLDGTLDDQRNTAQAFEISTDYGRSLIEHHMANGLRNEKSTSTYLNESRHYSYMYRQSVSSQCACVQESERLEVIILSDWRGQRLLDVR